VVFYLVVSDNTNNGLLAETLKFLCVERHRGNYLLDTNQGEGVYSGGLS